MARSVGMPPSDQPEVAQFAPERFRHGDEGGMAAAGIGRRGMGFEVTPALERPARSGLDGHDLRLEHQVAATDPRYTEQWDLYDITGGIRMPGAWNFSTGSGINVAVIDTGYRPHADLAGQVLPGYDFIATTAEKLETVGDISVVRLGHQDIVRHPLVASMLTVL